MPVLTGTIRKISVSEQFCCLHIDETSTGMIKYMLLWSYFAQEDNATNRLNHGMYLSLARDAFGSSRAVSLSHDSGSAIATDVSIE